MFGSREKKNDKKVSKQEKEMQKFMDRYQLEELSEQDMIIVKRIADDLVANNLFKTGMALTFAKAEEQAKVTYLSALVEQNWMIIRKLDEISNKLDK